MMRLHVGIATLALALPIVGGIGLARADCDCDSPDAVDCPDEPGGLPGDGSPNGAVLDHFQCYGLKDRGSVRREPLTLEDRFGALGVKFCRLDDICLPASKNDEDPEAPDHETALASYRLRKVQSFRRIEDQTVTNQFGTVTVDLVAPRGLLVPSPWSQDGPPSSPDGAFVDHFTCYDVRAAGGGRSLDAPGRVDVETALETVSVDLQKPWRLCVPTNKNGEDPDAPTHDDALLCYRTKSKGSVGKPTIFLSNQFGDHSSEVGQRHELCVPSRLETGVSTTTTPSTSSTSSTSASTTSTTSGSLPTTSTTSSTMPGSSTTSTTTSSTTTTLGSPSGAFVAG